MCEPVSNGLHRLRLRVGGDLNTEPLNPTHAIGTIPRELSEGSKRCVIKIEELFNFDSYIYLNSLYLCTSWILTSCI